ncbi:MAG: protein kinase [Thermoanaerobaculia bacterium]|nr:protein kinase [Thermoanaerobaculia bacterium]
MAERSVASARLSKLGRYEVLNELGKGAMGVVYLAKDPVIGRMVAIKTIRVSTVTEDDSESREFRERFIREAQTAGILSHSNIVTIHDIGEDADTQTSFIAMEYIEGKNLKMLLTEKTKFTYDQIAEMIAQVAEALDYAHRKGIIHRDIKPANIIITTDNKVKITDFGIAKIASSNLTTTGQFLGTPNYMSPEQVSGAPVDGRSDIFSLGVVLYELLTNRKPFQGENLTAISYKIVHEDFTPPAALSAAVPPEFNPIVARAMAKDPWNRYQRGKDFALALHQLRAHLEEQRALQDLGTLVSAAENLPTMKLANLDQLWGEGETPAASSQVTPPADAETRAEPSSASRRRSEMPTTPVAIDDGASGAVPPAAVAADALVGDADVSTNRFRTPLAEIAAMAPEANEEDLESPLSPAAASDTSPRTDPRPMPVYAAPPRPKGPTWPERIREWSLLSRREINPRWFWTVAAAIGGLVLLVSVILAARASISSRPTAPENAALETQTRERKQFLEQGKKLLNEGKYEQSLALFRKVLLRSPNNEQARLYAQMAENALAGRVEEAKRHAEAENRMQMAQQAFESGNYADAKRMADEVLALDGGRVEAQTLRDEASTKLAQEQAEAAALAAKKKPVKPKTQVARNEVAGPQVRPSPAGAAAPSSANPAATTATLRLLFDSPVSEGHIMVAVNNAILLRKPFSFKKKAGLFKTIEETGVVSATIPVNPGSATIKAWLSGPDIRGGVLAEGSANLSAGESRTLRLQYSGGNLSMRIQ